MPRCRESYWGAVLPGRSLTLAKELDIGQGQGNGLLGRNLTLGHDKEVSPGRNLTLGWDKEAGFIREYDFRLGQGSRFRHPDHP